MLSESYFYPTVSNPSPQKTLSVEAFHDIYEKAFSKQESNLEKGEKNIVARKLKTRSSGKKIIEQFIEREKKRLQGDNPKDQFVEVKFRLKIGDMVELFGSMDNVEKKDDEAIITEFKSTVYIDPPRPRDVSQLKTYALAYYKLYNIIPRGKIESLTTGKSVEVAIDEKLLLAHEEEILDSVQQISTGIIYPKPSLEQCPMCPIKKVCPFGVKAMEKFPSSVLRKKPNRH